MSLEPKRHTEDLEEELFTDVADCGRARLVAPQERVEGALELHHFASRRLHQLHHALPSPIRVGPGSRSHSHSPLLSNRSRKYHGIATVCTYFGGSMAFMSSRVSRGAAAGVTLVARLVAVGPAIRFLRGLPSPPRLGDGDLAISVASALLTVSFVGLDAEPATSTAFSYMNA